MPSVSRTLPEDGSAPLRRLAIIAVFGALVLAFAAVFGLAALRETPFTNSYAELAAGWLEGRLHAQNCFDSDCAVYDGRTYIIFPPMPGLVALPFVAAFGVEFAGFMPLSILFFGLSGLIWWRILSEQSQSRDLARLLLLLTLFATPLAFVALRGDHVWFFAQSCGFLFTSAALFSAVVRRDALLAGLFIGMAFLCRQMAILYVPLLYVMMLDRNVPLFRVDLAAIRRAGALLAFPLVAIMIYLAYNAARFGSPLETGYSYIFPFGWDENTPASAIFLIERVRELGIFSTDYFLFNAIYMFFAGPHVAFSGRFLTELTAFDVNGASPFIVAPALLFAFLAPWDRRFWIGLATVLLVMTPTLFYHSNGFSQFSAQRYALDWLPILIVLAAWGVKPAHAGPLALLVAYSMTITLGMIAVGGLLAG
ncbi:MAG: hypothetical protein MEP57_09320 [Microvirga sp.]|nr:hypothetical protein [Microvirga sp.]